MAVRRIHPFVLGHIGGALSRAPLPARSSMRWPS